MADSLLSPRGINSKEQLLQKTVESLETRYQDLKNRNQKLLEHIQNREKDNQKELDSLRAKLEENKKTTRSLEDKNLELKYENESLKRKEKKYLDQISKLEASLAKYQGKPDERNGSSTSKSARPSTMNNINLLGGTSPSTNGSENNHLSPPKVFGNRHSYQDTPGSINLDQRDPNTCIFEDSDEKERVFKSARTQYKSLQNLEVHNSVFNSDSSKGLSIERKNSNKKEFTRRGTLEMQFDAVIEESPTPTTPPEKLDILDLGGCLAEKLTSSALAAANNPQLTKKMSNLVENQEYVEKFNKLTQNIVSLAVKPEISLDEQNIQHVIGSPLKISEMDSPNGKRSLLKYTSKSRKFSIFSASSPQTKHLSPTIKKRPLFEDFFILGPSQQDLENFVKENPDKQRGSLAPKILLSYPHDLAKANQPPSVSIPDFTFPFGCDIKRIRSTPSFGGLNSIIYTSSDYDQRVKCFVFPLLSANLEAQEDPYQTWGDVIEASNPNRLLYIVCISFKDFITMTGENKLSLQNVKYWEVNKAMCFMSYYPFTSFFFDILMKVLNILKVERMVKMSEMNPQDLTRHEAVDIRFTSNYFETIVKKNLKALLQTQCPSFGSPLNFKLTGSFAETQIGFTLEKAEYAYALEASWAFTIVFRYMTYKDLLWFFTAILLERKLVFLSNNIHLLTATLFVMRSLIKPFNYPFPLIFNLPEVLMVYCDAPGAALIGINKGEEYLKEHNLFEDYPSCVFICLDEEKMYIQPENNVQPVQFSNFERSLMTLYTKHNSNFNRTLTDPKKSKKTAVNKPENIKITEDSEEKEKALKIHELFKTTLEKKLLKFIPETPIYTKKKDLDYEEIGKAVMSKAKEVDRKFLKEFLQTQIWAYYVEQYYQCLNEVM